MATTTTTAPRSNTPSFSRRLATTLGAAALFASAVAFASPTGAVVTGQAVSVTPSTGPIGTSVTVTGTLDPDCRDDSPVTVAMGQIDGYIPDVNGLTHATVFAQADATGRTYSVTGPIPDTLGTARPATLGAQEIHVYCASSLSSYPWWVGTASFTITGGGTPSTSTAPATTAPPSTSARATVGASSVQAGGSLAFVGSGFAPGAEVAADLHSDPVHLGVFRADASGRVSGTVTIPEGTAPGEHTLVLTGTGADGSVLRLEVGVTVLARAVAATPAAPVHTQPTFTG